VTDLPNEPTGTTEPIEPTGTTGPEELRPAIDPTLRGAVLELEQHASAAGWDQPAQLFALVPAGELVAQDPQMAALVGLGPETHPDVLVTVEQGELPAEVPLEELLAQIEWPDEVRGAAVVVERLVLPPSAGEVPVDPEEAAAFAAGHPDREEVRIIAAASRPDEARPTGSTYCAMRLRSRDDDFAVLEAPDLVPGLLELLLSTLGVSVPDSVTDSALDGAPDDAQDQ
jgi:hypothetical protein